eukprot:scaffold7949_cov37-Cyclotella_meneghiniana.AAC.9
MGSKQTQTVSTNSAVKFDLKGCLSDLQAAHHSDSEPEEEDCKDESLPSDDEKMPELPPCNSQSSMHSLPEVKYMLSIPTGDPDVEELILEAGSGNLYLTNGVFSPDSNAPMINLSQKNRAKGPNHMRHGGYSYYKKNSGSKTDILTHVLQRRMGMRSHNSKRRRELRSFPEETDCLDASNET